MAIKAVDFFCGIGGVTRGFLDAGIDVIAGIDIDDSCKKAFEENNFRPNGRKVKFYNENISDFDIGKIKKRISEDDILILIGCAPCQPFTTITDTSEKRKEERELLSIFADKVLELNPDYIFVENVSGLKIKSNGNNQILKKFIKKLEPRYHLKPEVKNAANFGVAQNRKRLIIFGKKGDSISHPKPKYGPNGKPVKTLSDVIGKLPPINAGETHSILNQHEASNLQSISLERLKYQEKPGDGMETWPKNLMIPSRKDRDYSGHSDVYARLWWNKPSSTLTTKFVSISNGRFGHPEQNRALSILEGLLIQSFPDDYKLFENGITIRAKHVGNAVPVKLAKTYANRILQDLNESH